VFYVRFLSGKIKRFHSRGSSHANVLEQKKVFTQEKSSTPTGLVWYSNLAAISLLWDTTNMFAVT